MGLDAQNPHWLLRKVLIFGYVTLLLAQLQIADHTFIPIYHILSFPYQPRTCRLSLECHYTRGIQCLTRLDLRSWTKLN